MTELPTTINVSKNAYRMFASMCRKTSHESEERSEVKGRTGKSSDKPFSSLPQAFLVAAALGIIRDKKLKPEDSAQLIRGEYLRKDKNYEPFKQLIKSKFSARARSETVYWRDPD
jgi:hypothetical protein